MSECSDANWSWIFFMMFNFNWSDSNIHNFFLKNNVFSIISNFFNNISWKDFFLFWIAFRIVMHVEFFWLIVLTRSNRNNFKSFSVSFNFCTIYESIFSADKTVWCICLFRSSDLSTDRSSKRLVSEFALSFFFSDW
jgi:hypothetical protein